jgi:hypothetical protein
MAAADARATLPLIKHRGPMSLTTRVDLLVPYVEKEDAKALGARWDKDRKVWFAPPGVDPSTLGRWLPKGLHAPDGRGADRPRPSRRRARPSSTCWPRSGRPSSKACPTRCGSGPR